MGKIYFTRHGQTIWNVENKICGATDIALTDVGHEQAKELGQFIKDNNLEIDEIWCSPLCRAKDTAQHISDVTGIKLIVEPMLIEQNFGKYEGTARNGEEFMKAKAEFINHFETGESMLELAQRIYNLLDRIKNECEDKTILLVAHNGIARVINSYFYDMTNEEYAHYGIKNCELLEYDI